MILTGQLFKYFIDNLFNLPDQVIHANKRDIKSIYFSYEYSAVNLTSSSRFDLSKLEDLGKLYYSYLLLNKN